MLVSLMAMIVGIVVGTYSSIYVATYMLLLLKLTREDMMLPVRNIQNDGRP
jgi:preprotein translocase subunit SecF